MSGRVLFGAWGLLLLAGLFEIVWALGLRATDGFTRPLPTAITLGAMAISVFLLGRAVVHLPIGTAYAVWTGVGAVGVALAGIVFLGEPGGAWRVASIALIVAGIVGLKLGA